MLFDLDKMPPQLSARPSPALFALINFRLGSHRLSLRVETDRWLPVRLPSISASVCRRDLNAVEDEQHFLFDCPLQKEIKEQHTVLFGPDQGSICLFLLRNAIA